MNQYNFSIAKHKAIRPYLSEENQKLIFASSAYNFNNFIVNYGILAVLTVRGTAC